MATYNQALADLHRRHFVVHMTIGPITRVTCAHLTNRDWHWSEEVGTSQDPDMVGHGLDALVVRASQRAERMQAAAARPWAGKDL